MAVEVYIVGGVRDLRGYQLHASARSTGSKAAAAAPAGQWIDMATHDRADHAFAGMPYWDAYNLDTGQLVVGIDDAGVAAKDRLYLATLTCAIGADSASLMIDLLHDPADPAHRTFLFATPSTGRIEIAETIPAIIEVVDGPRAERGRRGATR